MLALLAPALLVSIGIVQWSVLRGHVARAWRWVLVTTGAWVVALPPTFVIPALIPAEAAFGIHSVGWVAAGLVMASTMAATTGLGVLWLLPQPRK